MPRDLRIEYPGAMYHVMNRGDHRKNIFFDDDDRRLFLTTLAQACRKTDWEVHAYCLMRSHFHLVIETPRANVVVGMKWLSGVYTKRFNIRHKLCGHLLAGRYKAPLVEGSGNGYLRNACDYVHLNPARARLLKPQEPLQTFPWSSYPLYLKAPEQRPNWLRVDRVLGEHGIPADTEAGREMLSLQMERRRAEEADPTWREVRCARFPGSEQFPKELLAAAASRVGLNNYGSERQASSLQKAEAMVLEELCKAKLAEQDLARLPKGGMRKVTIARRLRCETTMSLKWIAQRLRMGSWTYVSNLLNDRVARRQDPPAPDRQLLLYQWRGPIR